MSKSEAAKLVIEALNILVNSSDSRAATRAADILSCAVEGLRGKAYVNPMTGKPNQFDKAKKARADAMPVTFRFGEPRPAFKRD